MADIFISYKSERRPAARHLKKVLDCYFTTGADECVWYDYGLVPGDDFEPRIMAEIAKAKVVLVLWCGLSVKSDWVLKEAAEAKRTQKFLPIRIEECTLPEDFAGADTINLSAWDASPRHSMLDRLLEHIGHRIGREPLSRISRLRELEEDWRGFGAPSLAHFALGKSAAQGATPAPVAAINEIALKLGSPPAGINPNLMQHWVNAAKGDAAALYEVGQAYANAAGGLTPDDEKAVRIFIQAQGLGVVGASASLGVMYENGRGGLAKDDSEAVRLYRMASDQGNASGQAYLGTMYANGRGGLAKDDREAVRLYRMAADQGNASGQAYLGTMYANGRGGLAKDDREAVRLFRLAADQGSSLGQAYLGAMYANGLGRLAKDDREAAKLFKLAADQGNASGQAYLGTMYANGLGGLTKDDREAVKLFRMAADQGNASGQAYLGTMYANGLGGLAKDDREAVRLYKLAAHGGNDWAQIELKRRGVTR